MKRQIGDVERPNQRAARILRTVCRLDGDPLRRNMAWWTRLRKRGVSDSDVEAAIRGVPLVMRLDPPWWPCKMLGKGTNAALWLEAVSASRRVSDRHPQHIGTIMRKLADG